MLMFCGVVWLVFTRSVPVEMRDLAMALVGCITTMAISAANYWLQPGRNADIKGFHEATTATTPHPTPPPTGTPDQ